MTVFQLINFGTSLRQVQEGFCWQEGVSGGPEGSWGGELISVQGLGFLVVFLYTIKGTMYYALCTMYYLREQTMIHREYTMNSRRAIFPQNNTIPQKPRALSTGRLSKLCPFRSISPFTTSASRKIAAAIDDLPGKSFAAAIEDLPGKSFAATSQCFFWHTAIYNSATKLSPRAAPLLRTLRSSSCSQFAMRTIYDNGLLPLSTYRLRMQEIISTCACAADHSTALAHRDTQRNAIQRPRLQTSPVLQPDTTEDQTRTVAAAIQRNRHLPMRVNTHWWDSADQILGKSVKTPVLDSP